MTDQKIIAVLNKIREDGDLSYKNAVPKLHEGDLLSTYGATILGNPHIKNSFLDRFMNYFMYEETAQHIFESEFDRLKSPAMINRYGTFEAFRNTIKPMNYDETKLDRILKLYKPDVKTAYFARNRQDIFPMSIIREELAGAFADFGAFDMFVSGLYEQLVNSNKVVEYNAIKECINVNVNGGAIKSVTIPQINSSNASNIAKMIRSYVTKMQKPSTKYNAYADMEGAEGEPVETQTPKQSLLLIADAETIAEISVDVLASAFNLAYADFQINLIEVDDFGYNIYNRANRTILGRHESKIKFLICDEALFKIQDNLDFTAEGTNDATLSRQTFYHIWQTIQVRPWANAIAFCYAEDTEITVDGTVAQYGTPVTATYLPTTATVSEDVKLVSSDGTDIKTTQPTSLTTETNDIDEIAYKVKEAFMSDYADIDTDTAGSIVVSRTTNQSMKAGSYSTDTIVISPTEYDQFIEAYGIKCSVEIKIYDTTDTDNYELVVVPLPSKTIWNG